MGPGDGTASAAVVDQAVHSLLQHPLLVADDDVGGAQLQQAAQAVVAVDDPAVQGPFRSVVAKRPPSRLDHGAQVGRQHRQDGQDHPLGTVARNAEGLHHLQPLEDADPLLAAGFLHLSGQLGGQLVQVDLFQQGPGWPRRPSRRGIRRRTAPASHGTPSRSAAAFSPAGSGRDQRRYSLQRYRTFSSRRGLMSSIRPIRLGMPLKYQMWLTGGRQLDVAHPLAADLGLGHLDAAALADLALVADALVFAAVALPVLGGSKDALAEQAVPLGLQGAVVDGPRASSPRRSSICGSGRERQDRS